MSKKVNLGRRTFLAASAMASVTLVSEAKTVSKPTERSIPEDRSALTSRELAANARRRDPIEVDVLVYCATPAGLLAAYSVRKAGLSVLVIEPSRWVGGILGAGLKPTQDMPNYDAVGGKTRDLMVSLGVSPALKISADDVGIERVRELMFKISPRAVREDFNAFVKTHDLKIIFDHRVSRLTKNQARVATAIFDFAPFDETGCPIPEAVAIGALIVQAKVFVDASYDGELMARAGVSYRVGRESRLDYDENLAGVLPIGGMTQTQAGIDRTYSEGNLTPISPFVEPNNPKSGLLPLVEEDHGKPSGAGDHYIQAYNFRYYLTSDADRRSKIEPPADYDPIRYELVGRYIEYLKGTSQVEAELLQRLRWIFPGWFNVGEYNYHRQSLFTIAPLGISHLYADGDYATKSRVWKEHQNYLSGLHHFLSTDARVPEAFRRETACLGFDRSHHPDTSGWPHQLYVRESRRLYGRYTLSLHDVYNKTTVEDPIGLAQYGVDSYPTRRISIAQGGRSYVAVEGNMWVGGGKGPTNVPYPIPYRSITPHKHECENLLVPVCFSASHLGYASARMEPTFMILGESSGVAAAMAIKDRVAVQDINIGSYLRGLEQRGQRIRSR